MTLRLDDEDLDARWRDGLRAAVPAVETTGAERRVARLVSRRRRRIGVASVTAVVSVAAIIGATFAFTRSDNSGSIHAAGGGSDVDRGAAAAVIHVTTGPDLTLRLDRTTVPPGVIEIVYLDGGGTHSLRIEGIPRFRLAVPPSPQVTRVHLSPGRYILYCDIPGHRQAGEQAVLTVEPRREHGASSPPSIQQNGAATHSWADLVAAHLPAGTTLLPLQPPASSVLAANNGSSITLLTYKLPSGRYFTAESQKGTVDPGTAHLLPNKGDTDATTAAGSRRYVLIHNAVVWTQVIVQRASGTMFMLSIESAPGVSYAQPPEFDVNGLVALSDALDNTGSDLS